MTGKTDSLTVESRPPGFIVPRKSWPRAATPSGLVPTWAGEFRDKADWVSFATNRLTGTYDPMLGHEVPAICVDAVGRRCTAGGHFRRAEEEGTFPVRFFWDMHAPEAAPLGYILRAPGGNIRLWTTDAALAARKAEEFGLPIEPFHTWPQDQGLPQSDFDRLRIALERIATGDGVYGAQAAEYKEIAREALKGINPARPTP